MSRIAIFLLLVFISSDTLHPVPSPQTPQTFDRVPQVAQAPVRPRVETPPLLDPTPLEASPDAPTLERVRRMIPVPGCGSMRIVDSPSPEELDIERWGESAFPAYDEILLSTETDPWHVSGLFDVLGVYLKNDRARFIPHAIRRLADPDALMVVGVTEGRGGRLLDQESLAYSRDRIRESAIDFLSEVGDASVTQWVRLHLYNEDSGVRRATLECLARIGGPKDLIELDICISEWPEFRDRRYHNKLKKCREELEKRLRNDPAARKT